MSAAMTRDPVVEGTDRHGTSDGGGLVQEFKFKTIHKYDS